MTAIESSALLSVMQTAWLAASLVSAAAFAQTAPTVPPPPARAASGSSSQTALPPARSASAPSGAANPSAQTLSSDQLAKVNAILAKYKSASLTADDAKLIKRTLRDAGMPRSPALDSVLTSAGFSPAKLDQLDPPPPPLARPADGAAPPAKK